MYVLKICQGKNNSSLDGKIFWNEELETFVERLNDATHYETGQQASKNISKIKKDLRAGLTIGPKRIETEAEDVKNEIIDSKMESTEDLLQQVTSFKDSLIQSRGTIGKLKKKLSHIEQKQNDLLHYTENYSFSSVEGYKILKQLKEVREERRKIKNAIEFLQRVGKLDISQLEKVDIGNLDKHPEKYSPRVLKELFNQKEEQIRRRNVKT